VLGSISLCVWNFFWGLVGVESGCVLGFVLLRVCVFGSVWRVFGALSMLL